MAFEGVPTLGLLSSGHRCAMSALKLWALDGGDIMSPRCLGPLNQLGAQGGPWAPPPCSNSTLDISWFCVDTWYVCLAQPQLGAMELPNGSSFVGTIARLFFLGDLSGHEHLAKEEGRLTQDGKTGSGSRTL